ncbi:MAG TPA: cytochrome b/b6 domain-containing protein [Hyphomonas sp.]|nr:cytochrome b/b6 domain-containing protein [Hyphomonas sp.]
MSADSSRVLVWDWAVRLFHWLAVLLFVLMWWTAENWIMDWHRRIGMMLVGLLTFRIVWGLIGPPSARFAAMFAGPGAILAHIRTLLSGGHKASAGHNPLGTLSVFAILAALCTQVGTGLFAVDVDGLESGPLARFVSFEAGRQAAEIHEISFNILLALVALHVVAIVSYLVFFKDNLVRPMVTGRRARADFDGAPVADNKASPQRVLVALVLAFAAMSAVWFAGGG